MALTRGLGLANIASPELLTTAIGRSAACSDVADDPTRVKMSAAGAGGSGSRRARSVGAWVWVSSTATSPLTSGPHHCPRGGGTGAGVGFRRLRRRATAPAARRASWMTLLKVPITRYHSEHAAAATIAGLPHGARRR